MVQVQVTHRVPDKLESLTHIRTIGRLSSSLGIGVRSASTKTRKTKPDKALAVMAISAVLMTVRVVTAQTENAQGQVMNLNTEGDELKKLTLYAPDEKLDTKGRTIVQSFCIIGEVCIQSTHCLFTPILRLHFVTNNKAHFRRGPIGEVGNGVDIASQAHACLLKKQKGIRTRIFSRSNDFKSLIAWRTC
jgi:hypothetical protein